MRFTTGLILCLFGLAAILLVDQQAVRTSRAQPPAASTSRIKKGLIVLYDFTGTKGAMVRDRSGVGKPLDLRISDPKKVRRNNGTLEVRSSTLIRSEGPADKLIRAIRKSSEITVEAWIRPSNLTQNGPARIVTLSKSSVERNFTLGQEKDKLEARLRTTRTSNNGIPSVSSARRSVKTKLTHLVYSRDSKGQAIVHIDGKKQGERKVTGSTSNWSTSFRLALANELSGDRPWLGTYHLVAVYSRALSQAEINRNFKAGAGAEGSGRETTVVSARMFEKQIKPILMKHCLECHGWKSTRGRLDLSTKTGAFRGGKSGHAIVPEDAESSLVWKTIAANEMPKKRPPLTAHEKRLIRQWIDGGAVWAGNVIHPLPHMGGNRKIQWIRRLTVPEYIETVRATVGVDIRKEAVKILPRDLRADGFTNTAYNLTVDLGHVEAYARLAEIIVGKMDVGRYAQQYTKQTKATAPVMRRVISSMGTQLLRGPLTEEEITNYLKITKAVLAQKGNFEEAVSFTLEAMLQAPRFIYRMEKQNGDGSSQPVTDYELASRLSYTLWGGPPDRDLLNAAAKGNLSPKEQVGRMLRDPRTVERSAQFVSQWLDLERLDNLQPNRKHFPEWTPELATDMRAETVAFFKDVAWKQKKPLADLLTAQFTYATPGLAAHYKLKPLGNGLQRYDLSKVRGRGGLLTHGSVLTIGGDNASMVSRGLFVLHDMLDGEVGDPPPCVDTTPVPTKPGLSQRGIAESRIANKQCGGCHSQFEPLAFGLEKFDGVGAYHETDRHGNKLRDDGEILFPGQKEPIQYKSAAEMMKVLAGSETTRKTIERKVIQFAIGRPLGKEDAAVVEKIHAASKSGGGTYESLIRAIVLSDLILTKKTVKE